MILLFACICSLSMEAANAAKALVVSFNDGTSQVFALADLPDITMGNDVMTIKAGATTAEFPLYTVRTFTFGDATGIQNVAVNELSRQGDQLIIPGSDNQVRIFAIDGKAVPVSPIHKADATTIDLGSLPHGTYIINANGKTVKIIK